MVVADAIERGELVARLMGVRAPMRKAASGEREVDPNVDHPIVHLAIHRFEEVARVGVFSIPHQGVDARRLHDLAPVHDDDAVGHLGDRSQIVRDEQHAATGFG